MQNYSTIIGVIELRQQNVGYATTQKRYGIGSSTVTLIMKRFKELGLTLEELRAMPPKAVEVAFYSGSSPWTFLLPPERERCC